MGFRNYRINITIRILVLVVAISAFAWFIVQSEFIRVIYLGILIAGLIIEFFYYSDKVNRDLNQFLSSILHDDFTSRFREKGKGKSFLQLYQTLDRINQKFKSLSKEKETRSQYMFSLIEQVRVGIISFEREGRVNLVNKAFNEMLDTPAITIGVDLKHQEPELFTLLEMVSLDKRHLLRRNVRGEEKQFSFVSTGFKMEDRFYNLVTVQDIREELDMREHEAWQKLIRVLTHEIMNSVSPISSLTGSMHDLLDGRKSVIPEDKLHEKLSKGLEAIQERSTGLIKFTEAYQRLARIPVPAIKEIKTKKLVERIEVLFNSEFEAAGIRFGVDMKTAPESFKADLDLFEQVIINLLRNASDAVADSDNAEINLQLDQTSDSRLFIRIVDNGQGIPEDKLDRIFVPFFSTKENGSGIGLSLSRQIVLMHRGTIRVISRENEGCRVEIII
jgi:nitrogen fixation/metabolism regulation signal transduction histidine kinase